MWEGLSGLLPKLTGFTEIHSTTIGHLQPFDQTTPRHVLQFVSTDMTELPVPVINCGHVGTFSQAFTGMWLWLAMVSSSVLTAIPLPEKMTLYSF